eukprot:m.485752 g.485752  ORF g.485752 m.485752 type:complete len:267 (-) comp23947_c0_seq1:60-860(-)
MTPEEEAAHWKQKFEEKQTEYDEFVESSSQLEQELEMEIEQMEKKLKTSESKLAKATSDLEIAQEKLQTRSGISNEQLLKLEDQLKASTEREQKLAAQVRTLEQRNDELERTARQTEASLESAQSTTYEKIEEGALLMSDLEEQQNLVQHLKEEIKDLRSEVEILQRVQMSREVPTPAADKGGVVAMDQTPDKPAAATPKQANGGTPTSAHTPAMSPSRRGSSRSSFGTPTRGSALNIVSDLLQRVSMLETKLTAARGLVPATVAH